jgi:molybdenum-dependent DNA-binding transcriptional regulator ModE
MEDMGIIPTPRHSLERLDVNGPYTKDNCKWATEEEQQNNRRNNHLITFEGETLSISRWATRYGLPYNTLWSRIEAMRWPIEKALTTPSGRK